MGIFRKDRGQDTQARPLAGAGQGRPRANMNEFMTPDEASAFVQAQAQGKDTVREPVFTQDLSQLSKRDRKRLRKQVNRELDRQLKEAQRQGASAQAEVKRAARQQARRASEVYRQVKARSKKIDAKSAGEKARRDRAGEVIDAIGYDLMFENGICEVEEGIYSETIEYEDITYQNAREDDQKNVLKVMYDIFNYFNAETAIQMTVLNTPLRSEEVGSRTFFDPDAQALRAGAEDAREMNRILNDKLRQGVSNIRRRRFMTISVAAEDPDEAYRKLSRVNTDLAVNFERLRTKWGVLGGRDRLEVINSMLRPGKPLEFDYAQDISAYSPNSTKDFVAPSVLDFAPDGESSFYVTDGKCAQALVMRAFDSPMEDVAIAGLADLPMPLSISWHIQPIDKAESVDFVKTRSAWIDAEIIRAQMKAVQQGYDYSILPSEVKSSKEETEDLLAEIQGQSQHLFHFTGVVWTWAEDFEQLSQQVIQIMDKARSNGIDVDLLEYRQRQGMNSTLPLGLNHVAVSRVMTTSEVCIFVPFATVELDDENGNYYGQNKLSNNLVLGNRGRLTSPVGFVAGKTGSGKGFFVKNEIEGTMLSKPKDQVIIFDRAGEYLWLTDHWGGQSATFGVGRKCHLNPLGMMGLEDQSDENQIAFKADAVLAQAGASAEEAGMPLTDEERSIIQRCVERVYMDARRNRREPVLEDLYRLLDAQKEPVAKQIALRYERFCHGATNFFNFPGNIDFDARIVDLNLKEVPESMIVFALITLCEAVRYQMYQNSDRHIRTWLYIEEMESLFKYSTVLNYFARFSRECRKFGMYLTGITQSTESMMRNPEASSIVKQADFVMLLKQSKEDRDYWADTYGLSPQQLGCIDDSTPRGNGLLLFGDSRIPIKGDFPTDSPLYDLFSTDPNEALKRQQRLQEREGKR